MNVLVSRSCQKHIKLINQVLGKFLPVYEITETQLISENCWKSSCKFLITDSLTIDQLASSCGDKQKQTFTVIDAKNLAEELKKYSSMYQAQESSQTSTEYETFQNYSKIKRYKTLDSTMDIPAESGWIVLADEQKNGVGRKNNKWISPRGLLFMTYNLDCPKTFNFRYLPLIQHIALVASVRSLNNLGVSTKAKWPKEWLKTRFIQKALCTKIY